MIEIGKGPRPAWFDKNQVEQTAAFMAAPTQNKPSPWRANTIVAALKAECRHKCMYCEAVIDDVSYSAVEHVRPKKYFPELVLEWNNLGLACQRCNTNKGEYWSSSTELRLINPYEDTVELHIEFVGPAVVAAIGSARGVNTIRKLKFDERDDLVLSRMRRIQELETRIRLWHQESDQDIKQLLAEDVLSAIEPAREFCGALRAYALFRGFRSCAGS